MKKRLIYNSKVVLKDWLFDRKEIMEQTRKCDRCAGENCVKCEHFYNRCNELNDISFQDEKDNLNVQISTRVVAIVTSTNQKQNTVDILTSNISSIFEYGKYDIEYFGDSYNIRAYAKDTGVERQILFRKLKPTVTVEQFRHAVSKNNMQLSKSQISYYTDSIFNDVNKVYGWSRTN